MSGLYIKYPPRGSGSSSGGGLTGSVSLTNQVSGILPIANGGTNSGTALNNLRFIISSGGAIVESVALTANAPLRTGANGLPTVGSTSLVTDVTGNLPLSQTSGSISLTNQVSGVLPAANGGFFGSVSLTSRVVGILPIANGGTGAASFDSAGIWVNGTNTFGIASNLGNSDQFTLNFLTNNTIQMTISSSAAKVGIGTTNPFVGMHVASAGAGAIDHGFLQENNSNSNFGGAFISRRSRGTLALPTAAQNGDFIGLFGGQGFGATTYGILPSGFLRFNASENFTDTTKGTNLDIFLSSNGSQTARLVARILNDNGFVLFDGNGTGSSTFTQYCTQGTTNYAVRWPSVQGSGSSTNLTNDGAGNLSWTAFSGIVNPMTTSGDIIIGSGGGVAARLALGSGSFTLVSNPALSPAMQYENITSPDDLRNVKLKAIGDGAGGINITLLSSQADGDPGNPPSPTNPLRIAIRNPNISSTNTRYHLVTITASMSCYIAQSSNGGVLASSGGYYWVYLIANPALPFPGNAYSLGWAAAKLDEGKLQNSFVDAQGINIGNGSTSWAVPISANIQAGMRFSLTSGGVVQAGFSVGVSYYVVNPTANGFGLSATSGGDPITAGSGGSQMAMHWQSPHLVTNSASFSLQPVRLLGRITPTYPATIGSMTGPVDIVCGGTILPPSPAVTTQVFVTGSGTYYLPPTCQAIKVTIVGSGGGGGGTSTSVATGGAGSGGGGGGTAIKYFSNPSSIPGNSSSTSFTFSVAAGGVGGTAGNTAGSIGSSSLFGTTLLAGFGGAGGSGGAATAIAITGNGGGGGNASGGDVNILGTGGLYGLVIAAGSAAGGAGGGTYLAGGTIDNLNSNATGAAGNLYGGGGAGGDQINNGGAQAGGVGANGVIIVEEYY